MMQQGFAKIGISVRRAIPGSFFGGSGPKGLTIRHRFERVALALLFTGCRRKKADELNEHGNIHYSDAVCQGIIRGTESCEVPK